MTKPIGKTFEGWDFDGTICCEPKGLVLKIYRIIEKVFPFITLVLPPKKRPASPTILIITASSNKVGVISWLKMHKIKYHSILFVNKFRDKQDFIEKLCKEYIETK
ncbi:hypothetical protein JW949_02965 [Candidatus Woesearchaeota archaeon]|nr:hypothetical protein [Candidatus Woesearchaeota archaeon]